MYPRRRGLGLFRLCACSFLLFVSIHKALLIIIVILSFDEVFELLLPVLGERSTETC